MVVREEEGRWVSRVMSGAADCSEVLDRARGKTGQFPTVGESPARPQHTPGSESEESNPSLEGGGGVQHWAKP